MNLLTFGSFPVWPVKKFCKSFYFQFDVLPVGRLWLQEMSEIKKCNLSATYVRWNNIRRVAVVAPLNRVGGCLSHPRGRHRSIAYRMTKYDRLRLVPQDRTVNSSLTRTGVFDFDHFSVYRTYHIYVLQKLRPPFRRNHFMNMSH